MIYVLACGDEGVQLNEGTRLGIVGAGFRLELFPQVLAALKTTFPEENDFRIVSNEENEWIKEKLALSTWEQVTASSQQHIEALADREGLLYAGFLPFSDPKVLKHGVKGHMVRPHKIHIANKICFTVGGGEQKYNLGRFVVSADWVAVAPEEVVKSVISEQIAFYQKLVGDTKLTFVVEETGALGAEKAAENKKVLEKLGFI